jgi:hypothetical protein
VIKVCQLLAQGRWFSPSTTASSKTKTGRHDIAEILLKVALKHKNINQSMYFIILFEMVCLIDNQGICCYDEFIM